MMVYRITLDRWADKLTGSGVPARWNSRGYEVIYTAGSRALACLGNLAHRSGEGLDQQFSMAEINIPATIQIETVHLTSLPENWYRRQMYSHCQLIGNQWLESRRTAVLKVPSAIIPDESNFLIHPHHPEFLEISIQSIVPFRFDKRLSK